jgi:ubiquinone/menaquinone biosynthesis C-methylase UbiE
VTNVTETERVRQISDKTAPRYDRQMGFWDRVLFAGAREWVCSQASGETLEIAIGSGRNLPHYAADVQLTGVELSPKMIELARQRAVELGRRKAVSEVRRVLRTGGRFVLAEHVRSPIPAVRAVEWALEPLTLRFEADHLTREPLEHIRAEGFDVQRLERSKWGIVERVAAARPA